MDTTIKILRGRHEVLRYRELLEGLAQRYGQSAAMHGIAHYLDGAGRAMTPYLLFVLAVANDQATTPTLENSLGAVLLYEFCVLGIGSGIFVTEGKDGMRSVIAPPAQRAAIAARCCQAIIDHKAHLVVASYIDTAITPATVPPPSSRQNLQWAGSTREVEGYLPLDRTLDRTLQAMNKHTRFNLRYYRRRLEALIPLHFVPDVTCELDLHGLLELNRRSLGPVSDEIIRLRHSSFTGQPGAYICGVRTEAGEWLSLIGGWRQGTSTVLQWQLNVSGYEKHSLVTVARSFWMEHEIACGTRQLRIDGGTTHAMSHSFTSELAVDLSLRRTSPGAGAFVRLAVPLVASSRLPFGRNSFLARTLHAQRHSWQTLLAAGRPRLRKGAATLVGHQPFQDSTASVPPLR